MKAHILAAAAALLIAGSPALAQAPSAPSAAGATAAPDPAAKPKRTRNPKGEAGAKREPSPKQLAARERQRKCSAEWKDAKAGGKVAAGATWPKFWSQCNARLKGNAA